MTNAQHTPGEWRVHRSRDGRSFLISSDSRLIAMPMGKPDNPETAANARLIVAAPEMLGLLQSVQPVLAWALIGLSDSEMLQRSKRVLSDVDALLAKLEGQ